MAQTLKSINAAEFFEKNCQIAGFDNPGKALYTSVRELVENGLDAAESIGEFPLLEIRIDELTTEEYSKMTGLANRERVDHGLYRKDQSEEQTKGKKKGKAAAAADSQAETVNASQETPAKAARAAGAVKARADGGFFRITVRDNGQGMPHRDIPRMLAVVLSGTNYGVKQTRGKFGLGAKMVNIWAKKTTGQPVRIRSAQKGQARAPGHPSTEQRISHYLLDLDLPTNSPNIIEERLEENPEGWRGSEVSVVIHGNYSTHGHNILKYLKQMAIITPYAEITYTYTPKDGKAKPFRFKRRTEHMPPIPQAIHYHPSAVDLVAIDRLIAQTKTKTLKKFLTGEFICIDSEWADRLLAEVELNPNREPASLEKRERAELHKKFGECDFPNPDADCLSPAGEYNLRLGVMKELMPELVATCRGAPDVHGGHPFIVEAAVSIGGKGVKEGLTVFRFANRIPLVFEPGADVISKVAKSIKWGNYKINESTAKLGVFVSIVSTHIPFAGASKEFIANVDAIYKAVNKALVACCQQIAKKLARRQALLAQREKEKLLEKHIPDASRAIHGLLRSIADMAGPESTAKRLKLSAEANPRLLDAAGKGKNLIDLVEKQVVTEKTFQTFLERHVQNAKNQAAESRMQQASSGKRKLTDFHLAPIFSSTVFFPELHAPMFAIRLLRDA